MKKFLLVAIWISSICFSQNVEPRFVKMDSLLSYLVIIAFVWCYKLGDFIDANFKKIKMKKSGTREISIFNTV